MPCQLAEAPLLSGMLASGEHSAIALRQQVSLSLLGSSHASCRPRCADYGTRHASAGRTWADDAVKDRCWEVAAAVTEVASRAWPL